MIGWIINILKAFVQGFKQIAKEHLDIKYNDHDKVVENSPKRNVDVFSAFIESLQKKLPWIKNSKRLVGSCLYLGNDKENVAIRTEPAQDLQSMALTINLQINKCVNRLNFCLPNPTAFNVFLTRILQYAQQFASS